MAPSRLLTVAASSALLLGLAFMIYLIRRRRRQGKGNEPGEEIMRLSIFHSKREILSKVIQCHKSSNVKTCQKFGKSWRTNHKPSRWKFYLYAASRPHEHYQQRERSGRVLDLRSWGRGFESHQRHCIIFQQSYNSGQVPLDWQQANVTAVFKKGGKTNPANYRPVSLTCIICKTMEHVIYSQIKNHLDRHHILVEF